MDIESHRELFVPIPDSDFSYPCNVGDLSLGTAFTAEHRRHIDGSRGKTCGSSAAGQLVFGGLLKDFHGLYLDTRTEFQFIAES